MSLYFSHWLSAISSHLARTRSNSAVTMASCDNVVSTDYCHGSASFTVPSACDGHALSLHCSIHGAMGGTNRLTFDSSCS